MGFDAVSGGSVLKKNSIHQPTSKNCNYVSVPATLSREREREERNQNRQSAKKMVMALRQFRDSAIFNGISTEVFAQSE